MARYNKIVDLYFSEDGDFALGKDGDLKDTSLEEYRGFIQMIDTSVRSSKGDWVLQNSIGADLSYYIGKPNTRRIGDAIASAIYSELYSEDLVRPDEVTIQVVPMTDSIVSIILFITPPFSNNRIVLSYSYNMKDNKLFYRKV